jgi:hypothetical protein
MLSSGMDICVPKNRCFNCRVKLSVVQQGIKCKCDQAFCGNCRYPEKHNCSFDFQQEGKNRLKEELVEVRGEKLNRI